MRLPALILFVLLVFCASPGVIVPEETLPGLREIREELQGRVLAYREEGAASLIDRPLRDLGLRLRSGEGARWALSIGSFLAKAMEAQRERFEVRALGGGRSGAPVFGVRLDGKDWGVFKLFREPEEVVRETMYLEDILTAHFSFVRAPRGWGVWQVQVDGKSRPVILMEWVPGRSISSLVRKMPPAGPERREAMEVLTRDVLRTARAMGEFHAAFTTGTSVSPRRLQEQGIYIRKKFEERILDPELREAAERLQAGILEPFFLVHLAATRIHGDANVGNFIPDPKGKGVFLVDVGSMRWSVDERGRPMALGIADVARFLQSLAAQGEGRISREEIERLDRLFLEEYDRVYPGPGPDREVALQLYRIDFELAVIRYARVQAEVRSSLARIRNLLEPGKK